MLAEPLHIVVRVAGDGEELEIDTSGCRDVVQVRSCVAEATGVVPGKLQIVRSESRLFVEVPSRKPPLSRPETPLWCTTPALAHVELPTLATDDTVARVKPTRVSSFASIQVPLRGGSSGCKGPTARVVGKVGQSRTISGRATAENLLGESMPLVMKGNRDTRSAARSASFPSLRQPPPMPSAVSASTRVPMRGRESKVFR
eukprot:TRINITY_DN29803_c0_g1_i1.p1 TRINITY_DN29803_c0_g1~~TRINITY_DN29803_c0_g1_i1.p1  ORF type:complete len:201 (-),score=23.86 TRINITY_DN29803_c0_g1_i1:283-885(-)